MNGYFALLLVKNLSNQQEVLAKAFYFPSREKVLRPLLKVCMQHFQFSAAAVVTFSFSSSGSLSPESIGNQLCDHWQICFVNTIIIISSKTLNVNCLLLLFVLCTYDFCWKYSIITQNKSLYVALKYLADWSTFPRVGAQCLQLVVSQYKCWPAVRSC